MRHKIINKLNLLSLLLFLSGCVNYQPIPEGYDGPLAIIQDTKLSISKTKVHFFELSKVQERNIESSSSITASRNSGRGMAMDAIATRRSIPAGINEIYIRGVTHVAAPILALGGGMYSIEGYVTVELEAGEFYIVNGELSKEYSAVWLEDSEGNLVSTKIEKHTVSAN